MDTVKADLSQIQREIVKTIDEFQLLQELHESMLCYLGVEHEDNIKQMEEYIEFLQSIRDETDVAKIQSRCDIQSVKLYEEIDLKKDNFNNQMQTLSAKVSHMPNYFDTISRLTICATELDQTHLEYNQELAAMEENLVNCEEQIKTLEGLLANANKKPNQCDINTIISDIDRKREEILEIQKEIDHLKNQHTYQTFTVTINPDKVAFENLEAKVNKFEDDIKGLERILIEKEATSIINVIDEIEKRQNHIEHTQNEIDKIRTRSLKPPDETNTIIAKILKLIEEKQQNIGKLEKDIESRQRSQTGLEDSGRPSTFLDPTIEDMLSLSKSIQQHQHRGSIKSADSNPSLPSSPSNQNFESAESDQDEVNDAISLPERNRPKDNAYAIVEDRDPDFTVTNMRFELEKAKNDLQSFKSIIINEDSFTVTSILNEIERKRKEMQRAEKDLQKLQEIEDDNSKISAYHVLLEQFEEYNQQVNLLEKEIDTYKEEFEELRDQLKDRERYKKRGKTFL